MKWRKFWEPTGFAPPKTRREKSSSIGRRSLVEALEKRQLFAADLISPVEIDTASLDGDFADFVSYSAEPIELRTMAVDDTVVEVEFDKSMVERGELVVMTMSAGDPAAMANTTDTDTHDVNGDGAVTAVDMLLVINAINNPVPATAGLEASEAEASATAASQCDVNLDGIVSPIDVLLLINYFNSIDSAATQPASDSRLAAIDVAFSEDQSSSDETADYAPLFDIRPEEGSRRAMPREDASETDVPVDDFGLLIGDIAVEDPSSSARLAYSEPTDLDEEIPSEKEVDLAVDLVGAGISQEA